MEKKQKLSDIFAITAELMDQVQNLQCLSDQVSQLGNRITKMTGELNKIDQDLEYFVSAGLPFMEPNIFSIGSNIIPFPAEDPVTSHNSQPAFDQKGRALAWLPILATNGKPLPLSIPDYRSSLQRDGLILLAWDKRTTEMGARYTAYWITSAGICRFYASKPLPPGDFVSARPDHKSYAAEDGIEFYGQEAPDYIVHVAPELMMSNPRHEELRLNHIKVLKQQGSKVDFNYKFLLKTEKNRDLPLKKTKDDHHRRTGA